MGYLIKRNLFFNSQFNYYLIILCSIVFSEIFHRRDINYNLRINSDFAMPNVRSASYGGESISYLGPKIWDIVP